MLLVTQIKNLVQEGHNKPATLDRDLFLVLSYYGFGDSKNPTLEDVAKLASQKFPNNKIGTRERARQIIKERFLKHLSKNETSLKRSLSKLKVEVIDMEVLTQHSFTQLVFNVFGEGKFSVSGIVSLLNEIKLESTLKMDTKVEIHTTDLSKPTKEDLKTEKDLIISKAKYTKKLEKAYKDIITAPGMTGTRETNSTIETIISGINKKHAGSPKELVEKDKEILRFIISKSSRVVRLSKNRYTVSDRENVLNNGLEKLFYKINSVPTRVAIESLKQYLNKRTPPKGSTYPDEEGIFEFLSIENKEYELKGNQMCLRSGAKLSPLEGHDLILYNILQAKPGLDSKELLQELKAESIKMGLNEPSEPYLYKLVKNPFVYADESLGKRKQRFFHISAHPLFKKSR